VHCGSDAVDACREKRELEAVGNAQLAKDPAEVGLYCALGDRKPSRNLLVGIASANELEQLTAALVASCFLGLAGGSANADSLHHGISRPVPRAVAT
jgi:hypothetical protein